MKEPKRQAAESQAEACCQKCSSQAKEATQRKLPKLESASASTRGVHKSLLKTFVLHCYQLAEAELYRGTRTPKQTKSINMKNKPEITAEEQRTH